RAVLAGLRTMDQLLVVVGDEEEAARHPVLEALEEGVRELAREKEILLAKARLHELEEGFQQQRVIVEVGVQVRHAVLVGGEQAPAPRALLRVPQRGPQEIDRTARELEPARLAERARGARESLHHHRVPAREQLL